MVYSLDMRVLVSITIAGLILGVIGSLYLAYDLLDRALGIFRWIVRVFTPTFLGSFTLGIYGTIVYSRVYHQYELLGALLFGSIGAMIGLFNGLFVDLSVGSPFFSLKNFFIGGLTAFIATFLADTILVENVSRPLSIALQSSLLMALVGAIMGGLWHFLHKVNVKTSEQPPIFSTKGCIIGLLSSAILAFLSGFIINLSFGVPLALTYLGPIRSAEIIAPVGGILGGISSYFFWWANNLPPKQLGAIGVMLTLVGFIAQLVQPLVELLKIPTH